MYEEGDQEEGTYEEGDIDYANEEGDYDERDANDNEVMYFFAFLFSF